MSLDIFSMSRTWIALWRILNFRGEFFGFYDASKLLHIHWCSSSFLISEWELRMRWFFWGKDVQLGHKSSKITWLVLRSMDRTSMNWLDVVRLDFLCFERYFPWVWPEICYGGLWTVGVNFTYFTMHQRDIILDCAQVSFCLVNRNRLRYGFFEAEVSSLDIGSRSQGGCSWDRRHMGDFTRFYFECSTPVSFCRRSYTCLLNMCRNALLSSCPRYRDRRADTFVCICKLYWEQ